MKAGAASGWKGPETKSTKAPQPVVTREQIENFWNAPAEHFVVPFFISEVVKRLEKTNRFTEFLVCAWPRRVFYQPGMTCVDHVLRMRRRLYVGLHPDKHIDNPLDASRWKTS